MTYNVAEVYIGKKGIVFVEGDVHKQQVWIAFKIFDLFSNNAVAKDFGLFCCMCRCYMAYDKIEPSIRTPTNAGTGRIIRREGTRGQYFFTYSNI